MYKKIFIIFALTMMFSVFCDIVTAEEMTFKCTTDKQLTEEGMDFLINKKNKELNQEYNLWDNNISTFSAFDNFNGREGHMPSTGNVKALVLTVSFPNAPLTNEHFAQLKDYLIGDHPNADKSQFYCHHDERSVKEIYRDMSNGKLNFSADIMPIYTVNKHQYWYSQNDENLNGLKTEILTYYKQNGRIKNFADYDSDHDGYIDCLVLMYNHFRNDNEKRQEDGQKTWGNYMTSAGVDINDISDEDIKVKYCAQVEMITPNDKITVVADNRYVFIHECMHLKGLRDNYLAYGSECYLYGTNELMNGDWDAGYVLNPYYRYILDWIEPKILPYTNNFEEIGLTSYENSDDTGNEQAIILIPNNSCLPFTEYYMIEYRKDVTRYSNYGAILQSRKDGGVILWHVNSQINTSNGYFTGYKNSTTYIKPVYKNGGKVDINNIIWYQEEDVYRIGDVWSSTTTPSSDFYNGYKTGAYMEVVSMDEEKATVRVGFQDMNWEQPTVSVTGKYHTDYRNVSFSLFYDDIYQIMGKRPTESQTKTEDISKEIIDKYIEVSADNIPVQIDYSQCYLAQNKVYISVKDAEHDKIETNGSVIQLRLKEGSATNGFNKKCGTAFCEVKTPDLVPPTGTITYSTTEPTTESVTATLTSFSEEIQPIETMQHTFYRNGSYTFEFYDLAGNKGTATAIVDWIDREPVTAEVEYSTTELTNQDVTVKIIPSEPVLETEEELTFVFKSNGKKLFVYHDIYGNQFIKIVTVDWIDKKLLFKNLRSIDKAVRNVSGGSSSNNVKFDGSIISMIKPREKVKPAKLIQALTEDENEYIFELEDLAGNRETYRTLTNLLSKEASDGKIEYSSTEWTNEDVTVSIIPRYDVLDSSILTHRFEENGSSNYRIDLKSGDNISFTVNVGWIDKEAPIITLKGQSEIILECGEEYIEQGAEITDDQDMMIDDKLKISGTVDTSKAGTYTVTYNATDHAGNVAEQKIRTVTVLVPPPSPTPTATPSPTPSPSPTAEPTATPTASPTVKPTATPTATPTVKPTASPSPTPTTELTPTPTVTLSDRVEFERQADETILAKIIFEKTTPPKSEDLVLYIAYYRDNRLIKLEIPTITEMTAMFKIDEASQDCEIRAYVWDKEMQPLMEVQKMNK